MFQSTSKIINQASVPSQSFYSSSTESVKIKTPIPVASIKVIPPVSARAFLVGNVRTGKIYLKQNSDVVLPVASMSKLLTAIEVLDTMAEADPIVVTENELNIYDNNNFVNGERFTVKDLLHALLLGSSNVAAEALASSTNRIKFLELMSSYAWEIGMSSTYFADPSGIDPHNVSSANDFFELAKYLYELHPSILAITRTPKYILATTTLHQYHNFVNIHPFVNDPDFLGGKTGHTAEAKDTMLTILNINKEPIAIIVLSSDDRKKDTLYLIAQVKKILEK